MDTIPADTLKTVLDLRKENGLEATEAALRADLTKSKAKWSLVETPRYRRAGRSPLYISGKYLSSAGKDPATGEADSPADKSQSAKRSTFVGSGKEVDETAFYKVL